MESVKVDLVNCYGIKKLQHTFDFSKKGAFAIYAPNGVMKSSLAQTFLDASNKVKSVDRIFSTRATVRTITDETGAELEGERVLVVLSYNDQFGTTEKTSTLLVDPKLREEHSQLLLAIHTAKDALLKAIQQQANSKMNFEKEIASAFTSGDDFETALNRIDKELREQKEVLFADVKYDKIFDEKVVKALNTKDLKSAVDEYIRRYNELLAASTYFKKGTVTEASLYEAPFEYVRKVVKPLRDSNREQSRRENWWRLGRSGRDLVEASNGLKRAIFSPRVAKHRLFVWAPAAVVPDSRVVAICRDDDISFGILHSKFHEVWSLVLGGWHGVGNDPQYTPSLGFETFPFPEGFTPDIAAQNYAGELHAQPIASAAAELDQLRDNWLNPADLVRREPEVVKGYPDRVLPVSEDAEKRLEKRTLTNLYNEQPAWLIHAHRVLDQAVADAYGWGNDFRADNLSDDEILARLYQLNLSRTLSEKLAV